MWCTQVTVTIGHWETFFGDKRQRYIYYWNIVHVNTVKGAFKLLMWSEWVFTVTDMININSLQGTERWINYSNTDKQLW